MGISHVIDTRESKDVALAALVKKYDTVHFIDDKAKHIDEVKQKFPDVVTYFIKRPDDKPYGDQPSVCECNDHTITDLSLTIT